MKDQSKRKPCLDKPEYRWVDIPLAVDGIWPPPPDGQTWEQLNEVYLAAKPWVEVESKDGEEK